jgi:hypothetical protein
MLKMLFGHGKKEADFLTRSFIRCSQYITRGIKLKEKKLGCHVARADYLEIRKIFWSKRLRGEIVFVTQACRRWLIKMGFEERVRQILKVTASVPAPSEAQRLTCHFSRNLVVVRGQVTFWGDIRLRSREKNSSMAFPTHLQPGRTARAFVQHEGKQTLDWI